MSDTDTSGDEDQVHEVIKLRIFFIELKWNLFLFELDTNSNSFIKSIGN
jgi:hypothetical protein